MNYTRLSQLFHGQKIFSLDEIRMVEPTFCMVNLSHRQIKGYIRSFTRGWYYFLDARISDIDLHHIANLIYDPSYISLETALQIYNIIPEAVPHKFSITSKKTTTLNTKLGTFIYKKVKPQLFFGYTLQAIPSLSHTSGSYYTKLASREKTVMDYIYLHPSLQSRDDFYKLRRNIDELMSGRDEAKFITYTQVVTNKAFHKRVQTFISFIHSDDRHYDY